MKPTIVGLAFLSAFLLASFLLVPWLADGRKLEPDTKEVLIREVGNGYVVSYRTRNNPYPVWEVVAVDVKGATTLAGDLLKRPVPKPQWGK